MILQVNYLCLLTLKILITRGANGACQSISIIPVAVILIKHPSSDTHHYRRLVGTDMPETLIQPCPDLPSDCGIRHAKLPCINDSSRCPRDAIDCRGNSNNQEKMK